MTTHHLYYPDQPLTHHPTGCQVAILAGSDHSLVNTEIQHMLASYGDSMPESTLYVSTGQVPDARLWTSVVVQRVATAVLVLPDTPAPWTWTPLQLLMTNHPGVALFVVLPAAWRGRRGTIHYETTLNQLYAWRGERRTAGAAPLLSYERLMLALQDLTDHMIGATACP